MASTRFLFWNINRKPLGSMVAELAKNHGLDVIILAECDDTEGILHNLNHSGTAFHLSRGIERRLVIFSRFSTTFLPHLHEEVGISIRSLELPDKPAIILAAVHLPSKRYSDAPDQEEACRQLATCIDTEERKAGHQRTILVGDFNMDPFEPGIVAGLSSVMSRRVASRRTRTVQGLEHYFFYNPMWSHLGDAVSDTAGSYFYDRGRYLNYYWHMFDQVMLRPALAERFDPSQIQILDRIGSVSLVRTDGKPDDSIASDHLPILFEVEF